VHAALERVGLVAAAGKRYRAYSLGMRQRLCLAGALLRPRSLLVLDEPTNGLDPQGTREIRQLVRGLAADGTTVFLSSHLLAEIEQVCTHAAVMAHGRLVAQDTVEALRAAVRGRLVVRTPDTSLAAETLSGLGVPDVRVDGDRVHGEAASADAGAGSVRPDRACAALVNAGVRVFALDVERPSLEEAFVALTGEGFDVAE
jgi:ABC-2 type transport system ATP-binding protein